MVSEVLPPDARYTELTKECWVHWFELAHRFQYNKGAIKILKYEESFRKTGIVLPQTDDLYKMFSIDENAWGETSSVSDQRARPTVGPSQISSLVQAPPSPNVQRTAPKPSKPGDNKGKQDESKVLKAASELRQKILEGQSLLLAAGTYEDYHQDIINDFEHSYKANSGVFQAVLDDPGQYSKELVDHVKEVVKAVQQIHLNFESFSRGQSKFDAFKIAFANISNNLSQQAIPTKPLSASGLTKEQADIPKKNDKPVSNIDMNSVMSSEINKKAAFESQGNEEDNIYVPEHLESDAQASSTPNIKVKPPSEDQEDQGDFMAANFDDEDGEKLPGPQATFSMAFGSGDDDGWGRIAGPDSNQKSPRDLENNQPAGSKTTQNKKQRDPRFQSAQSISSKPSLKEKPMTHQTPGVTVSLPASPDPAAVKNQKAKPRVDESNVMDEADEDRPFSPRSNAESGVEQVLPSRMTEEEKIKLALKNQKVLEGSGMQDAMKDFFSKPNLENKVGVEGALGSVFAKAKSKYQGNPPDQAKGRSVSSKPQETGGIVGNSDQNPRLISNKNPPTDERKADGRSQTVPKKQPESMKDKGKVEEDEMTKILREARLNTARKMVGIEVKQETIEPTLTSSHAEHQSKPRQAYEMNQEQSPPHDQPIDYFHRGDGGLLEDGHDDYHKPLDKEKIKQEIQKLEEDRKRREQLESTEAKKEKSSLKGQSTVSSQRVGSKLSQEEIKKKSEEDNFDEDFFVKAGFGAEGFSKDNGKEFYDGFFDNIPPKVLTSIEAQSQNFTNVDKRQEKKVDSGQKLETSERNLEPESIRNDPSSKPTEFLKVPPPQTELKRQDKHPAENPSFNASDFFGSSDRNDQRLTTAVRPDQSKVLPASKIYHQADSNNQHPQESRANDDSELFFAPEGRDPNQKIHLSKSTLDRLSGEAGVTPQKLADILSENNRLRQENSYANKSITVLEDSLANTTKQLRIDQERQSSQNRALHDQTKLLELAYEREKKEREMFEQKYKDLYLKWRQEKEVESMNASIFDPKKILELSQVNEQLKGEKRVLAARLSEEVEKSKYVESLKEELNKTKKELLEVTKAYNSYMADMSKTNLNPEESILKDLYQPKRSTLNPALDLQAREGQESLPSNKKIGFGSGIDGEITQSKQSGREFVQENRSPIPGRQSESPDSPSFSSYMGPKTTMASTDRITHDRSQTDIRKTEEANHGLEDDLFDRAERLEKEAGSKKNQDRKEATQADQNTPKITFRDDLNKSSPEFTDPFLKSGPIQPVNSNGSMVYNHGIGLRSSRHSHMSQVDRLESDLLDQSDLDFLANFQKELDDTCKKIVSPKAKPDIRFDFPRTSTSRDQMVPQRSTMGQPERAQHNWLNSQQFRHSIGGTSTNISATTPIGYFQAALQPVAKPGTPVDHIPLGPPSEKFDIFAPFTSSYGTDIPLPKRSHPQPMRDSLYSKDSASGATVFSTATRPTFRY